MSIDVLTRSFSNQRDGANLSEAKLTSSYVQANGIRQLAVLQMDDARGTEGQPLIATGLTMRDGLVHDIILAADMSNNVYAWDWDTYELIWKQHVGNPVVVTKQQDMWGINPTWGILSTPAINKATQTIFVVSLSTPDGTIAKGTYRLHALSLVDGTDQAPPLTLDNANVTTAGRTMRLGDVARKQRPGLLFDSRNGKDTVFIAFGSFAESASSNNGFVLAVDVTGLRLAVAAVWTTGAKYPGAGIWMGGQGLSMDDNGDLYLVTGNGGFDPPTDFGECAVRLRYTPTSGSGLAKPTLTAIGWHSPYSDAGRDGQDPTWPMLGNMSTVGMDMGAADHVPNNAMTTMLDMTIDATSNRNAIQDQDLGSGGPLLALKSLTGFTKNVIIFAGKDGIAYVADADDLGNTMPADFAPDKIAGNTAKLLFPPYGLTFNGVGVDLMPTDLTMLPGTHNGYTNHVHGTPVEYRSPDHGFMIFVQGENGPVRAFTLGADFSLTYVACGREVASAGMAAPGGMPGGMLALSADGAGTNTGVLWALMPLNGDANKRIVQGRLVAYGANWDDDGYLIKLWDSADWGITFMHNKFNPAVPGNGKVLVPSYDGTIRVMG